MEKTILAAAAGDLTFGVTVGGSLLILLAPPNIFEIINQKEIIERLMAEHSGD